MGDIVIKVDGLGKKYRLGAAQQQGLLRDRIMQLVRAPWRRAPAADSTEFWALRDVSFEVARGEVIGVVGRNGAGKSTLLKILSRITDPTVGQVRLRGRVASLLEVGTGFHAELSGRDNIFLNGSILGMTRSEIRRKFDEIVAFAEVERFIDTAVKYYSSGMYVRLAFAVAAYLEPEILIIDEVLAVGDAEFQKKCLGKMGEVAQSGRTVLFVSHNMAAVENLCTSAILLAGGRLMVRGSVREVTDAYFADLGKSSQILVADRKDRQGTGEVRLVDVGLQRDDGTPVTSFVCGKEAVFVLKFQNPGGGELRKFRVSLGVDNSMGQRVLLLDSFMAPHDFLAVGGKVDRVRVRVPRMSLVPGHYHLTIQSELTGALIDWVEHAASFDVEAGDYFGSGNLPEPGQGFFVTDHEFSARPPGRPKAD